MNHDLLKTVIYDQHDIIRKSHIIPRSYSMEEAGNYILIGLRRAGKSTLLHKRVLDLVENGVDWNQIIFINFEDERLIEFTAKDFQDIVEVQKELSDKPGFFFFDEIQNIDGWEKFVRRLVDAKERVFVTGSNAKMLSSDMERSLGGRLLSMKIMPYSFREYLTACDVSFDEPHRLSTTGSSIIRRHFEEFLFNGGLPESLMYTVRKNYIESVYQKTLLGDIIARNDIRNDYAMRVLMKKIAETVRSDVSFSRLHKTLLASGASLSKDTLIDYVENAKDAFLLFSLPNAVAKFAERESTPKYYFADNGILNLFLVDKESALLENLIAIEMYRKFGDVLCYLKSSKTKIDVDFYVPEKGLAVQVAWSVEGEAYDREVGNLVKLAKTTPSAKEYYIVTKEERRELDVEGVLIHVLPAPDFLLDL